MLSRFLGTTGFGLYTSSVTIATLASVVAGLGINSGLVYFGSRALADQDNPRLQSVLRRSIVTTLICGSIVAILLAVSAYRWPDLYSSHTIAHGVLIATPLVLLRPLMRVIISALHVFKDMRSSAIALNLTLPAVMIVGGALALATGAGVVGAIIAASVSFIGATLIGLLRLRTHIKDIFLRPLKNSVFTTKELIRYSAPLSAAGVLYRLNMWMDIVMLTWLTDSAGVGQYRVAAALAMFSTLTTAAVRTALRPMVAEIIFTGETERLRSLLQTATKWSLVTASPIIITAALVPDLLLSIFGANYVAASGALVILVLGQTFNVAGTPLATALSMGGHADLEMKNGAVAVTTNIVLNWVLIPEFGFEGAALAAAISISLWSLLRVFQVIKHHRVVPFSGRSILIIAATALATIGLVTLSPSLAISHKLAASVLLWVIFTFAIWNFDRSETDVVLVRQLTSRLRRVFRKR